MKFAFLIVAVILFVLEFLLGVWPNRPVAWGLTPLGLAFFAASFAVA